MAPKNGLGADVVPEKPELGNNNGPEQPEIEIKEEIPVENGKQADINDKEKKIEYLDNLLNEEQPIIDEFSDLFYDNNKVEIEKMNVSVEKKPVEDKAPEKDEDIPEENKVPEEAEKKPEEKKAPEEPEKKAEEKKAPEEPEKKAEEKKAPEEAEKKPEEQQKKKQGASEDDDKKNNNEGNSDKDGDKDKDEVQIDFSKRPTLFENVMLFLGLASPELKRKDAEYKEQLRRAYEANQKKQEKNNGTPTPESPAHEKSKPEEKKAAAPEKAAEKKENLSDKDLRELISLKINDEEKMLRKYPQDSLYAMAIRDNVKRLSDLHTMLLEGTASPDQINKCSEKVVGGLVAQDLLKQSMDKNPDMKKAFTKDGEGKHLFGENFEKVADHPAVKASIESNGKTAVTELLTKPKTISKYSSASALNIKDFQTKGSKLVDANNFGAITKNPQTGKWEKMSGVNEGAVTGSINTMRNIADENKIFNSAAQMTKQNISPEKQGKAIDDRIAEIDKLLQTKSDDKAICSVAKIAKKNLSDLKENGMPKKGSKNYEEQKEAYRSVVASLFSLEHIMKGSEGSRKAIEADESMAQEYVDMHRKKDILNGMSRSFGDTFANYVIDHSIEDRALYKIIRDESKLRRKCEIPESAECYGALFRNSPKEKWQATKTASEKYINESYLGLMKEKPLTSEEITANKNIFKDAPDIKKNAPQKDAVMKEIKMPSAEPVAVQPVVQQPLPA